MIIVPERKTVVITPPRTASTSVRDAILERYPKAMALYRHRERDGIPDGYNRWRVVGLMRHPLARLLSLYNFMKAIPRHGDTARGTAWLAGCRHDVNRPFWNWLTESEHTFHVPWDDPKYDMVRYAPVTRRSLEDYYTPWFGETVLYPMEHKLAAFERDLDITLVRSNEATYGPNDHVVAKYGDVMDFIYEHHPFDLSFYDKSYAQFT